MEAGEKRPGPLLPFQRDAIFAPVNRKVSPRAAQNGKMRKNERRWQKLLAPFTTGG
jgi:hypothetical protein